MYEVLFSLIAVFFVNTWWIFLTIIFFFLWRSFYLYWIQDKFWSSLEWAALEITLPEEVTKTPKAMETALEAMFALYDAPNFKEKWFDGKVLFHYSFEIVGIGGEGIHIYIILPSTHIQLVRTAIYSQYPEAEIQEVDRGKLKEVGDYIKKVPPDVPNEEYDLWGTDLRLLKPDPYPIRTYTFWQREEFREERSVDPLATIFEFLSSLKEGEHFWIQILARPITNERSWKEDGEKLAAKIMGRKPKTTPGILEPLYISKIPEDIARVLIEGEPIPERIPGEEEASEATLFKLTPGESETIKAIEENIAKQPYEVNVRFLYIARRDVFFKPQVSSFFGHFSQFGSANLNSLVADSTKTKAFPWFFEKRRLYHKQRKLYRYYIARRFPWHRPPYVLSSAELATIFHFPSYQEVPVPGIRRVEQKKGGPPQFLPIE